MNTSRALAGLLRKTLSTSAPKPNAAVFGGILQNQRILRSQIPQKQWILGTQFAIGRPISMFTRGWGYSTVPNAGSRDGVEENDSESKEKEDVKPAENATNSREKRSAKPPEAYDADSDFEDDGISREELIELVKGKSDLLKAKQKEIQEMQEKVLRSYAEAENMKERTRRDAENSKKFAIQSFAKSLLDVADNLGRASSVVKESFSKLDATTDSKGATPLLKTLLEGVEMTERQLSDVFKKYGVERFDPLNDKFDPNRHMAVFQVPSSDKEPDTVAVVLKSGYTLHERVIRPAEVGVVVEAAQTES